MTRLPLACLMILALAACGRADTEAARRHLEHLCDEQEIQEEYLDFYWDDLRTHQPEVWAEALATCAETCPPAVNCAPVLSVASWYQHAPVIADPQP